MFKNALIGVGIVAGVLAAVVGIVMFFSWITPDALSNDQIISETKSVKMPVWMPTRY